MKRIAVVVIFAVVVAGLVLAGISYAQAKTVTLPEPERKGKVSVEEAIQKRRSVRSYSSAPLSLQEAAQMLWAAGGKTIDGVTGPTRSYASAGGRYPLDIYFVAGNVTGLDPGVYRYDWSGNSLALVKPGDVRKALAAACYNQGMVAQAPATIVLTTTQAKAARRYGAIGGSYVYLDAGHLGQNVHLQAEALGLGTCMIGAYAGESVSDTIGAGDETTVYVMPIGKPR